MAPAPSAAPLPTDEAHQAGARRRPIQERSQDRVQRILQAAAELVDNMPLEDITMAVIAKRAGASFSSIYRFFPSKEAILEDVVMGYLDKLQAEYEDFFARAKPEGGGAQLIEAAIDIYAAFMRREPGFKALWLSGSPTPEILARFRRMNATVARLAKSYGVAYLGMADNPDLDLRLAMAAEASSQLLKFAFTQTSFDQDRVIAELKRLLKASLLILS
jgi:AcrR family transcriptional regulator